MPPSRPRPSRPSRCPVPSSARRPSVALVVVVLLGLAGITACARVPDSGPPVAVTESGSAAAEDPVLQNVNAPITGAGDTPEETVAAYRNALRITRNTSVLGDRFLVAGARPTFTQNTPVSIVKDFSTTSAGDADAATAVFSATLAGEVEPDGSFVAASDRTWRQEARLVFQKGEWRFLDPPPLVVAVAEFGDAFNPVTVYFAAKPGPISGPDPQLLLPEQRYVDEGSGGSATEVVDFLLSGPSRSLSSIARNPLPGAVKRTSRVTFEGGDVVVELSPEAESARRDALNAFVAEVAWSLNAQFSGRVRLLVGARPLQVKGVQPSQGFSSWGQYNPAAGAKALPDYLVQGGRVVRSETVPDTAGKDSWLDGVAARTGVRTAAVSAHLTRLAVVRADASRPGGERLWVSDASGTLQPSMRAPAIGRPSWGGSDATVIMPVAGRLYQVGVGDWQHPTQIVVRADGRPITNVRAVRVALDGLRVLIVAGNKVYLGALITSANVQAAPVLSVTEMPVLGTPLDVAWYGTVTAAVADRSATGRISVLFLPIDGSPGRAQDAALGGADPVRVAADPSVDPASVVPLEVGGRLYGLNALGPRSPTVLPGAGAPFFPG
jgi:hypothetical protein